MRKYLCREAGCNTLLDKAGYCEIHYREPRKPFENAIRANEGLYNTSRWKNLRKECLKENPYCAVCGITMDLTIDHIIGPRGNEELFFDPGNLQVLCRRCHRYKTAKEINDRRLK